MNKEIRASEESKEQRFNEKCKQLEEKEKSRTKRLSRYKYQDESVTFQLSEDLTGSLRQMRVCILLLLTKKRNESQIREISNKPLTL